MVDIPKILIFIAINAFGFFSVGICYTLGALTGVIDPGTPDFDHHAFQNWFFTGTIMTWLVCAVFSTAYFFVKGPAKYIFLWAPVCIPFAYGFSIIFLS